MKPKHQYKGPSIRIDRYLVHLFPEISRSYLQQIIEKGGVNVNDLPCRKGTIVHPDDWVEVMPFPKPNERIITPNSAVQFTILHRFEHYIVLEKPPFLPTHPNQFDETKTLANGLVAKFPQMSGVGEDRLRPGIVHRLDTNTSGIMLAALTPEGFRGLRELFNQRLIRKTYLALVLGTVRGAGEIATDIAHHEKNPRRMVALQDSTIRYRSRRRAAKTLYESIEVFENYSFLKVRTLTGRMHQVRVHLSSIGHPLVGDELYQTPAQKSHDHLGLTRHVLHASTLEFPDPWRGTEVRFESSLPPDIQFVIDGLSVTKRAG